MNALLALAIPTWNRTDILKENLQLMIDEIRQFEIPIYFSDDGSDNSTQEMLAQYKENYPNIFYIKNPIPIGHDLNCVQTMKMPSQQYVWYLSDAMIIKKGGIQFVLNNIEQYSPDILIVSEENRGVTVPAKIYANPCDLMLEIGWHLTLTSVSIYSKKIIELLKEIDLKKCRNFPQTALIFEAMSRKGAKVLWSGEKLLLGNPKKKSYWYKFAFEVFLVDWVALIENASPIYNSVKKETIPTHAANTGFFSNRNLFYFRYHNTLNLKTYRKYKEYFRVASGRSLKVVCSISIFPRVPLVKLISLVNWLKKTMNK